jgi:hypothetical protein
MFGAILHGAVAAFGWLPHWGDKLKAASKAFDSFANGVEAKIRGIPKFIPINIHATFTASALAAGYLGHHASGGRIGGSGWSIVGEQGPELIYAPGAMVKSNSESKQIAGVSGWSGAGGGAGEVHLHFHNSVITSKKDAADLVYDAIQTLKRTRRIQAAT